MGLKAIGSDKIGNPTYIIPNPVKSACSKQVEAEVWIPEQELSAPNGSLTLTAMVVLKGYSPYVCEWQAY